MEKIQNIPVKKKKKKMLRTPSHILRLCIVWAFIICIFLLSTSFKTTTLYINDKLEVTPYLQEGAFTYSTLEEIKAAESELQKAIDNLQEKPKTDETSDSTETDETDTSTAEVSTEASTGIDTAASPITLKWLYHITDDIEVDQVQSAIKLVDEAKAIDRSIYTEESIETLNKAVLKTQKSLGATVTMSQNALQIMFGGSIAEMYGKESASSISNSIFICALAIIPIVGFLAASFDKSKHIKHIIATIGSILAVLDIMFVIYPFVDIGSVATIIMYIVIAVLTVFSIYAKQQEDYIVKHPELEAEYSDKHPHFVKALINYKAFGGIPVIDKKEQERVSAQNAKKHRNKKK